jgi:hypothetical protein
MRKLFFIIQLIFLLSLSNDNRAQILSNYYPLFESNKGIGNAKLSYNLYSINSGTTSPVDSNTFDTYIKNGTLQKYGTTTLAVEKGTINTASSNQYNAINWNSFTQLQNALFSGTSPYSGFGDYYAFIVSGYFIPKETGTYKFTLEADDADELVINNKVLIALYNAHGPSALGTNQGSISLVAGVKYAFRVRMQESQVGEQLNLFWQKPSEQNAGIWYQDVEEVSSLNVINRGLVQKLDFNNFYCYPLVGSQVYDIMNNSIGTIAGPVYYPKVGSKPNSSLYFNGNGQYVSFGATPANFPTGDMSVSVWIYFTALNNGTWNIFLTKWFGGTSADFHFAVRYNGSNYYQNIFTTNISDKYGVNVISPNTWYNLGFTIKNGGDLQLYLNGKPDGTVSSGASRTNTNSILYLGDYRAGVASFTGYINAVNIYNRALSASDMLLNYNAEKSSFGFPN